MTARGRPSHLSFSFSASSFYYCASANHFSLKSFLARWDTGSHCIWVTVATFLRMAPRSLVAWSTSLLQEEHSSSHAADLDMVSCKTFLERLSVLRKLWTCPSVSDNSVWCKSASPVSDSLVDNGATGFCTIVLFQAGVMVGWSSGEWLSSSGSLSWDGATRDCLKEASDIW